MRKAWSEATLTSTASATSNFELGSPIATHGPPTPSSGLKTCFTVPPPYAIKSPFRLCPAATMSPSDPKGRAESVATMFPSASSTAPCSRNYVLAVNLRIRLASTKMDCIPCRSSGPLKSVRDGSKSKRPNCDPIHRRKSPRTQTKKNNGSTRTGVENSGFYVRICLKYMMRKTVLMDGASSGQWWTPTTMITTAMTTTTSPL